MMHNIIIFMTFALILDLIGLPIMTRSSSSSNNFNYLNQAAFTQLPAAVGGGGAANQRPNFLVIIGDDFGYSDIGAAGSEISTPNLDTLAKDGKILTNYHTAATCSPARVSLLTGVDYHIGGIGTMFENVAPNQVGKYNS